MAIKRHSSEQIVHLLSPLDRKFGDVFGASFILCCYAARLRALPPSAAIETILVEA